MPARSSISGKSKKSTNSNQVSVALNNGTVGIYVVKITSKSGNTVTKGIVAQKIKYIILAGLNGPASVILKP
jgi:hypothetical protein